MAVEIERKFLLKNDDWKADADEGKKYAQGYLTGTGGQSSIRVRTGGDKAWLNIKSATPGMKRTEYEYEIPLADASEMIQDLCLRPVIIKTRYLVRRDGHLWEIDVFEGENAGLVVAEIELESVDETFSKPAWVGEEVTDDRRYYNICLVENPYKNWAG